MALVPISDNSPPEKPEAANMPINSQFASVIERLNPASNVLVTVSNSPSVDQLAAAIGLTLALNKLGKHATAVFSGEVPSTIEFLQPEKTLEKNTDSLRDFIIALDKSKADKLRYKIEDQYVKVFITPYKSSITEDDLQFGQGDFNVDTVVALGVHNKAELDACIIAHGRILHDAAVLSLNNTVGNQLGTLEWRSVDASSLCEMTADITRELSGAVFDAQIATALLTGIVAETNRFSNEKATPNAMSIAGILMAAGASAQLVSSKLEEAAQKAAELDLPQSAETNDESLGNDNGTLQIQHASEEQSDNYPQPISPTPTPTPSPEPDIQWADEPPMVEASPGTYEPLPSEPSPTMSPESSGGAGNKMLMSEPPKLGGQLTANSIPEYKQYTDTTDPLSKAAKDTPILTREDKKTPPPEVDGDKTLTEIEKSVDSDHPDLSDERTLTEIEEAIHSPHLEEETRDAVAKVEKEIFRSEPSNEPEDSSDEDDGESSPPPPPPVPPPLLPQT